jgi:hypothetical protein
MPARLARLLRAQWVFVLLVAALAAVGERPALAAAPYVVSGVDVDVTAADSATARDQAIADGQRKAFAKLMEQLVGPDQAATIQTPSDSQLAGMVQDFEVESVGAAIVGALYRRPDLSLRRRLDRRHHRQAGRWDDGRHRRLRAVRPGAHAQRERADRQPARLG